MMRIIIFLFEYQGEDLYMFDIVGVDMPCLDLNLNVGIFPKPNGGAHVQRLSWQGGGKIATGIAAAGRLGAKCAMMGAVGDDMFGSFCLRDLERHHVDTTGFAVRENRTTSFVTVISDKETGGRSFVGRPGTAERLSFDEINKDFLKHTKYFFISSLGDEVEKMTIYAKKAGAKVFIDADGYSDRLMTFAPEIDFFIASEDVFHALGGGDENDIETVAREVMQKGPSVVVFTLGPKGCAGISAEGFFKLPAYEVDVVDTVGAGDVYHGAFLAGLLSGRNIMETARFASAAAAIKCTRIGGRAGIPDRPTLERFLLDGFIDYTEIDKRAAFYERAMDKPSA